MCYLDASGARVRLLTTENVVVDITDDASTINAGNLQQKGNDANSGCVLAF